MLHTARLNSLICELLSQQINKCDNGTSIALKVLNKLLNFKKLDKFTLIATLIRLQLKRLLVCHKNSVQNDFYCWSEEGNGSALTQSWEQCTQPEKGTVLRDLVSE